MELIPTSLNTPAKIGLAALGVLLIGATVFFKERLFFVDASFTAFNIINSDSLFIANQRYGSFITHLVPYLGQRLHLPIKIILIGYAICFNFFFISVAALIVYRYKQYKLAILMALYFFIMVSDSYFWFYDELHQAIAWMFLFFAITIHLGYERVSFFRLLVPFIFFAFLTIFTHFIAIIVTLYLWIYFIIKKEDWPFSKNMTILLSCLLFVIIGVKFLFAQSQDYDISHLHGVTNFSLKAVIKAFNRPVVKMFLYRSLVNYWCATIIFVIGIVSLIKSNKKAQLIWTLVSLFGYFTLMGLTYGDLDNSVRLFHIETEWQSMSIIIASPFVFTFLPMLSPSKISWVLIVIFVVRLGYIAAASPAFTWRTQFKENVMAQMKKKGITKLALEVGSDVRMEYIQDWALPFETILTSAADGDKPMLTFFFLNENDKLVKSIVETHNGLFVNDDVLQSDKLNSRYFIIDTTHPYQIMTYEELFK